MLDIEAIKEILPHREPFLMIDRIDELETGKSATARKAVSGNEWFFTGHFKDKKIMPGVLILEAIAQTGAVALMASEGMKGKLAYLGKIKQAKFMQKVVPGDLLIIHAQIETLRGTVGTGTGKAFVDGVPVTECSFMFALDDS